MTNNTHGNIEGVDYAFTNGKWYFSSKDVIKKFGLKNLSQLKSNCPTYLDGVSLDNGTWAITFKDLMHVAKNCADIPMDFVDGLFERVKRLKDNLGEVENHPDFSNPAEAARAWATQYELRKSA